MNAKLKSGDTALHRASYTGKEQVVRLLIRYRANACKGADGQTPLHKVDLPTSSLRIILFNVCKNNSVLCGVRVI